MSANNWGICPRCKSKRADDLRALDIDLAESYGQVPVEEFDRLRAERDAEVAKQPEPTMREDYETWIDEDGRFYVSYSAHCRGCGFAHKLLIDEQLDLAVAR